jgi:hypothetical protein
MTLLSLTTRVIFTLALLLSAVGSAHAQLNRSFVSVVGDDANPCFRTAPCKTFAGANAKTNPGGEMDVMESGGYGSLVISKSITIDGSGVVASAIGAGTLNSFRINANDTDIVVLRHISMMSDPATPGNGGIRVDKVGQLHVIDCLIKNFTHHGIDFEASNSGARLFVTGTTIINNGTGSIDAGVFVKSVAVVNAIIDHCTIDGNHDGVVAKDRARVSISNSLIAENHVFGAIAASDSSAGVEINIESTIITRNQIGIQSGNCAVPSQAMVRISNVSVTSNDANGLIATVSGPTCRGQGEIISAKNNTILGNRPDGSPTSSPGQQ